MPALTVENLLAYCAQVAVLVAAATAVAFVSRVRAPGIAHAYWRLVLAIALLLPLAQPLGLGVADVPPPLPTASGPTMAVNGAAVASISAERTDWAGVIWRVVAAGVAIRLLWLGVGMWRLSRLRRHPGEPADAEFAALQRQLQTRAEVRYTDRVAQPVMFGVRRPVVLLPSALRAAPADIRQAIVVHELWHVRRRDGLSVVLEELVRAALWFHPAIWWLIAQTRATRERLVDACAVMTTGQRATYVRALLLFADTPAAGPVAAFGWRRQLFHRIVHVTQEDAMSSLRLRVSVLALAAALTASSWWSVRAFPLAESPQGPGVLEQRAQSPTPDNPVPRRLVTAQPVTPTGVDMRDVDVTVTLRTVIDETGAVAELRPVAVHKQPVPVEATAPDGRIVTEYSGGFLVQGDDTLAKLEQMYDRATFKTRAGTAPRAFDEYRPLIQALLDSAETAARQWRYESPAAAPLTVDVLVRFVDGNAFATPVIPTVQARQVPPDAAISDGAVRVGASVRQPKKIKDVKAEYPPDARVARIQGVVILEARIGTDGRVKRARVLRSIPLLDQAALDAVEQWEFEPTAINGVATPLVMTVTVQFSLGQ